MASTMHVAIGAYSTAVAPDRASANRKTIFLMRRPGEVACGRAAPLTPKLRRGAVFPRVGGAKIVELIANSRPSKR